MFQLQLYQLKIMENYYNWNRVLKKQLTRIKIYLKKTVERQKPHLDYLVGSTFHGVNRLFVL